MADRLNLVSCRPFLHFRGSIPPFTRTVLGEVILQQPAGRQAENRDVGSHYQHLLLDAEIKLAVSPLS
jgi:hypothetical protein